MAQAMTQNRLPSGSVLRSAKVQLRSPQPARNAAAGDEFGVVGAGVLPETFVVGGVGGGVVGVGGHWPLTCFISWLHNMKSAIVAASAIQLVTTFVATMPSRSQAMCARDCG